MGPGAAGGTSHSGVEGGTGPTPLATIEPAPPGLEPRITRDEALNIAWREEGRSDANSVDATLAISRIEEDGGTKERPVWIVTYEGVCVIAHGPPQGRPPGLRCAASTYGVMCALPIGDRRSPGRSPRRVLRSASRSSLSMNVPIETPQGPDSCPPEAPVLLPCAAGCGTGNPQDRRPGSPSTRPAGRRRGA